jgi:hypothetical protein
METSVRRLTALLRKSAGRCKAPVVFGAGQSPERSSRDPREACSERDLARRGGFGWRRGLGREDRGGEKAVPTVGQDAGRLKSRGWRRAFTLRSYIHPCPPLPSPPPARPLPRWRDASGAGQGPGNDARDTGVNRNVNIDCPVDRTILNARVPSPWRLSKPSQAHNKFVVSY